MPSTSDWRYTGSLYPGIRVENEHFECFESDREKKASKMNWNSAFTVNKHEHVLSNILAKFGNRFVMNKNC